jgi:hypothetical protein
MDGQATEPEQQTIRTTLGALCDAQNAIDRLAQIKLTDLPPETSMKTAYHMKRLIDFARKHIRTFNDLHGKLIKELGEPRDPTTAERRTNGGQKVWQVKPDNADAFVAQVGQLREQEVTIAWRPLDLRDLGGGAQLSIEDLIQLGELVIIESKVKQN